jgi:hypothetical protein
MATVIAVVTAVLPLVVAVRALLVLLFPVLRICPAVASGRKRRPSKHGQMAEVSLAMWLSRSRLKISFSAGAASVESAIISSSFVRRKLHTPADNRCQEN